MMPDSANRLKMDSPDDRYKDARHHEEGSPNIAQVKTGEGLQALLEEEESSVGVQDREPDRDGAREGGQWHRGWEKTLNRLSPPGVSGVRVGSRQPHS